MTFFVVRMVVKIFAIIFIFVFLQADVFAKSRMVDVVSNSIGLGLGTTASAINKDTQDRQREANGGVIYPNSPGNIYQDPPNLNYDYDHDARGSATDPQDTIGDKQDRGRNNSTALPPDVTNAQMNKNSVAKDSQMATDFFKNASYPNIEGKNLVITPGALALAQSIFLEKIRTAFSSVAGFSLKLLYYFAAFEFVVFGLAWALQHDSSWGKVFFKIIKIGIILFIIQNYTILLEYIINSFVQIAGVALKKNQAVAYIANPARVWQYGYDAGIYLLKSAVISSNFGLIMVQIVLGVGILLVFGLLGIQLIMQMVGFYFVSLGALILLPFGAFVLSRKMFDKAVQSVFQAGIRLMVIIIIIGIAVAVWDGFGLANITYISKFSINQFLGLFFTALLFLYSSIYFPRLLSQAVGDLTSGVMDSQSNSPVVVSGGGFQTASAAGDTSGIKRATEIDAGATAFGWRSEEGSGAGGGAGSVSPTSVTVSSQTGTLEAKLPKEVLSQASEVSKSISENTVKKIKDVVLQAVKEKK